MEQKQGDIALSKQCRHNPSKHNTVFRRFCDHLLHNHMLCDRGAETSKCATCGKEIVPPDAYACPFLQTMYAVLSCLFAYIGFALILNLQRRFHVAIEMLFLAACIPILLAAFHVVDSFILARRQWKSCETEEESAQCNAFRFQWRVTERLLLIGFGASRAGVIVASVDISEQLCVVSIASLIYAIYKKQWKPAVIFGAYSLYGILAVLCIEYWHIDIPVITSSYVSAIVYFAWLYALIKQSVNWRSSAH